MVHHEAAIPRDLYGGDSFVGLADPISELVPILFCVEAQVPNDRIQRRLLHSLAQKAEGFLNEILAPSIPMPTATHEFHPAKRHGQDK